MASLRDIRKRIKSVKNTQKITKAMKMVSAAKLKRAQDRVVAARPYADKLAVTVASLARRAEGLGEAVHPLLAPREGGGRIEILLVTSDRGLCGGFNSNAVRKMLRFRFDERDNYKEIRISTIGRKGAEAMKRERVSTRRNYEGIFQALNFKAAEAVALELSEDYINGELDGLFIVYNEFVNAGTQRLNTQRLLPAVAAQLPADQTLVDFEYEPNRQELLSRLLPRQLAMQIYRALLESQASEHAARMTAMENASKNAKEMVESLTLGYNRARQAAITKELMEIIGGAEALK